MIPVENLYMMLAYAWNRLDEAKLVDVSSLPRKNPPNLLARVLCSGVAHLVKRGFHQEYDETADELAGLRGKINAAESIKRALLPRGRAFCEYDEYSPDVVHNQIVKATLRILARCDDVASELRTDINRLLFRFAHVSDISLSKPVFRAAVVHRHTATYAFLLDVCRLVFEESLPAEDRGRFRFRDFYRDKKKMWRVFQDFIYHFYRTELPGFRVSASHVKWDVVADDGAKTLLPSMQTDVSLRSQSRHIILDTKYTSQVFQRFHDKASLRSGHLYQMLTYMKQQAADNAKAHGPLPEGILLYPLAKDHVDTCYTIAGQALTVATVDLNKPWDHIRARLLELIHRPVPQLSSCGSSARTPEAVITD